MENNPTENKIVSKKRGVVVSDKGDKTIVVAVGSYKTHSKYKKKYRVTKKYKAHDEENKCKIGDTVEIVPSRPRSAGKQYIVN